jgi:eukaryotic-like serine/threonine-protein kinase
VVSTAQVLADVGRFDEALAQARRAVALLEGSDDAGAAQARVQLGTLLARKGDNAGAAHELALALALQERVSGPEHPSVGVAAVQLAGALSGQGRHAEALAQDQRALALLTKALGPDHPKTAFTLSNVGDDLRRLGRHAEAVAHYRKALVAGQSLGPRHPFVPVTLTGLGRSLLASGATGEALRTFEKALALRRAGSADPSEVAEAQFGLAQALWASRREKRRAVQLAGDARELLDQSTQPVPALRAELDGWLARNRR